MKSLTKALPYIAIYLLALTVYHTSKVDELEQKIKEKDNVNQALATYIHELESQETITPKSCYQWWFNTQSTSKLEQLCTDTFSTKTEHRFLIPLINLQKGDSAKTK